MRLGLALAFVAAGAVGAVPGFPALSGRVVDQAEVLSSATEGALDAELAGHEARSGQQLVVVTLATLGGYEIADYGYQLGRHWGIGRAAQDDGVLLIVAPAEHQVRIEVGYGLEGTLTDALCRVIIEREIVPRFKRGDLDGGVRAGATAILAALAGSYQPPPPKRARNDAPWILLLFLIVLVALIGLASQMPTVRGGRFSRGWGAGGYGGGYGGGRLGGGGFGGGGFGGGGGGFGGGGASGRW